MSRVFAHCPGDRGRVMPKIQKMVIDADSALYAKDQGKSGAIQGKE